MTIRYDIPAKPTVRKGVYYRSRLEAKWAAFFDLLGWAFEYEPYDLGEWSPDFFLHTASGTGVLVEVKPIVAIDAEVCGKMARAARGAQFKGDLLLVGIAPPREIGGCWSGASLGWCGELWNEGTDDPYYWQTCGLGIEDKTGQFDFSVESGSYHGRITGCGYRGATDVSVDFAAQMWALASASAQWKPPSERHRRAA